MQIFKKCSKCYKKQKIELFQKIRPKLTKSYRLNYCNECRKKQSYAALNNIQARLFDKYYRTHHRAKKLKIPFNISKVDFVNIYYIQKGRCFYTNEVLEYRVGRGLKRNCLSVDRLIPEKGYIKGNIVFCTHKINSVKNDLSLDELKKWIPKWYQKIQRWLKNDKL